MLVSNALPIGGYIELQLPAGNEYYPSLLKLNTGRNSLEYILSIKGYTGIYLPYFTCEVMLEPVKKLGLELKYYHVDRHLDPVLDFDIGPAECLVYTNYFGIKQETVRRLSEMVRNLIIDNSQAFFSEPLQGIDTFYSCRKFFGVPDGAYLQLNSNKRLDIQDDFSAGRFSHLIKSIDLGIEDGYGDYIANNNVLCYAPIRQMSPLTRKILSGIDYDECKLKRHANFHFLHYFLADYNELPIDVRDNLSPLVYPLLIAKPGLKKQLIENKIFVATYWPNVLEWTSPEMLEYQLADNIIALPIDHRYNLDHMTRIVNVLNQLL
ncbi:hypothetical protein [Desertivirga xinjiangensis]|uniref:hypothetical protein n=1 Tax=Desertivirga xinjiangensis TaxID=539206 RepID=UPI00210E521A|nr:hypothetical protein [Pedobacter xinjiangensis]